MIKSGSSWLLPIALALAFGAGSLYASSQSTIPSGGLFGTPVAVVSEIFSRF